MSDAILFLQLIAAILGWAVVTLLLAAIAGATLWAVGVGVHSVIERWWTEWRRG